MHAPPVVRLIFIAAGLAVVAACSGAPAPAAPPAEIPAESPVEPADTTMPTETPTPEPTPAPDPATTSEPPQGKRAAGEENLPMNAWRAFGNEPFWSVRVDGDTLVFSTPEDQAGKTLQGKRVPSLVGVVYLGQDGGVEFNLTIQPGECSDGMSDNRYEFVSTFIYGDMAYRGCAEAAK